MIEFCAAISAIAPPTSLTIQEGMPFSLACEVRGQPVPTVTWYKDGMPFRPDLLDGVEMVEGGLQFGSASDDFSGEYVCTASPVGTGSLPSPPAIVKVLCKLLRLSLMHGQTFPVDLTECN